MGVRELTEPFVVGLVQPLVADGMVLPAVHPVDAVVGEEQVSAKRSVTANDATTQGTHKGTEATKYAQPYSDTSSYIFEYPLTSAINHGRVRAVITGNAFRLD